MPLVYVNPILRRALLGIAGALVLTTLIRQGPDIVRYIKIKRM